MTVHLRVRAVMARLGLNREGLAARWGCAPRTVQNWMSPTASDTMPLPVRRLLRLELVQSYLPREERVRAEALAREFMEAIGTSDREA